MRKTICAIIILAAVPAYAGNVQTYRSTLANGGFTETTRVVGDGGRLISKTEVYKAVQKNGSYQETVRHYDGALRLQSKKEVYKAVQPSGNFQETIRDYGPGLRFQDKTEITKIGNSETIRRYDSRLNLVSKTIR